MTDEHKHELRELSSMRAFTFYLDDITKVEVLIRLRESGLDTAKGTLSALIRVLLHQFARTDDIKNICNLVQEEYLFTTKKNKRSSM